MNTYGGYSEIELISAVLLAILATSSLVATLITLYLIYDMNRWNGYMLLIFNLTLFQALYDVSFYFLIAFREIACFQIFTFLATFSGLAVSIWTNIISFVLFYIVMKMKSFHIKFYIKYFFVAIVVVSGLIASLSVAFSAGHNDIQLYRLQHNYYYFRILSIIVNISIHIAIQAKLYHLGLSSLNSIKAGGRYVNIKAINDPLKILAARLKYYPIVQIVTWVGAAWYEFEYGFNRDSFDADKHYTVWQQVCIYVDVICSPSAGLGFFVIFLVVQPTALAHLKFKLKYLCNCLSDSDNLNSGNRYAHKMSGDFQYSTASRGPGGGHRGAGGESNSFESAFTTSAASEQPPFHTAESLTDPFMAQNDHTLFMDDDHLSVTSGSTQGNTRENRGAAGGGNRLPTGSFYEMDEEELAQQMDSKYNLGGHRKGSSFNYMDNYTSPALAGGGGGLRHNTSSSGLAGLNTVHISHISSIPNNITIATSPSGGGVAMPATNNNNSSSGNSLRGRAGSGQVSGNRIRGEGSQEGINF